VRGHRGQHPCHARARDAAVEPLDALPAADPALRTVGIGSEMRVGIGISWERDVKAAVCCSNIGMAPCLYCLNRAMQCRAPRC